MDKFMQAAIEEARIGLAEGGIPIGSVIVHQGAIIGKGHNQRVQCGSAILHGEMAAFENAGRQPACIRNPCYIPRCLLVPCVPAPFCFMAFPRSSLVKTGRLWAKKTC